MQVAKAYARDLGNGYARIDKDCMKRLGVQRGDIVSVGGGSKTIAMVWHAHRDDQNKGTLELYNSLGNISVSLSQHGTEGLISLYDNDGYRNWSITGAKK